jgi:hypothetical protein
MRTGLKQMWWRKNSDELGPILPAAPKRVMLCVSLKQARGRSVSLLKPPSFMDKFDEEAMIPRYLIIYTTKSDSS